MLDAFRLIPALQAVFTYEIEFTDDSFVPLTKQQHAAYVRREGNPRESVYRVVNFEPQAIERTEEKVTLELAIVTASERKLLMDAVTFVYKATESMTDKNPSFTERLDFLRPRLPPIATKKLD